MLKGVNTACQLPIVIRSCCTGLLNLCKSQDGIGPLIQVITMTSKFSVEGNRVLAFNMYILTLSSIEFIDSAVVFGRCYGSLSKSTDWRDYPLIAEYDSRHCLYIVKVVRKHVFNIYIIVSLKKLFLPTDFLYWLMSDVKCLSKKRFSSTWTRSKLFPWKQLTAKLLIAWYLRMRRLRKITNTN